jgi:hypothetical protein
LMRLTMKNFEVPNNKVDNYQPDNKKTKNIKP